MVAMTNGLPPGSKCSNPVTATTAMTTPTSTSKPTSRPSDTRPKVKHQQTTDLSLSAVSSGIVNTRLTRDTLSASPGRMRNQRVAPPIPRRADFGEYYPDGGWGWIVCGAAFTVHFLAHGLHLAFGTTLVEMVDTFHLPPAHIGKYRFLIKLQVASPLDSPIF